MSAEGQLCCLFMESPGRDRVEGGGVAPAWASASQRYRHEYKYMQD